ncbi:MAG TPA: hypothetical protein VMN78_04595 [Longimicrobiales bacterium]|nr:hypothetical protein [Longimicrobiales bacterium]
MSLHRAFRRRFLTVSVLLLPACADDAAGPDRDDDVEPTLELPREVAGVTLELSSFDGVDLVDTTAAWRESLAALGVSTSDLSLSLAVAPDSSPLTLEIAAFRADGVEWSGRLDAFASALASEGQIDAERREIGGRDVWWAHAPGDSASSYFHAVGDVLFTIRTDDEAIAAAVLGPLGRSPSDAPAEAPVASGYRRAAARAGGVITISLLQPPRPPVCVAEPLGRQTVMFMTIAHTEVGPIADPWVSLVASSTHGELQPALTAGMHHSLLYAVQRFGLSTPDNVTLYAVSAMGAVGNGMYQFQVQHCMNGTWADGARTLRIRQILDQVTATIESGTLTCGATGQAFSGTLQQERPVASMSGSDMKVCNPPECVDAGLLEQTALVPYEMTLADDGMTADFEWTETLFDYEYDDENELVACTDNGSTEMNSFSIHRFAFGPERPF